jgi:hypothetical protein
MNEKAKEEKRIEAFKSYLDDLGLSKHALAVDDGKYNFSGTRNGQKTFVTFDPGTIPDGTYNIFLSDDKHAIEWCGVIVPKDDGRYALRERNEKAAANENAPAKAKAAAVEKAEPQGSGKHRLHLVRHESAGKKETGRIVITDDHDRVIADCHYTSGPWGKGRAPDVEHYLLQDVRIKPFYVDETRQQDGLRIADQSFKGERSGILIHKDEGPLGTLGCFGIQGNDWDKFKTAWESIPIKERPQEMRPLPQDEYKRLKGKGLEARAEQAVKKTASLDNALKHILGAEDALPLGVALADHHPKAPFDQGFGADPSPRRNDPTRGIT